jgi:hypothetical protein
MRFEIGCVLQFSYSLYALFVSRLLALPARLQNSNQNEFRRTEAIKAWVDISGFAYIASRNVSEYISGDSFFKVLPSLIPGNH